MFAKLILSLATGFVFLSGASAQIELKQTELTQPELVGIKCVVDGAKAASSEYQVKYRDGHVCFSSERCANQFVRDLKRDPGALLSIKANHQLVVTGQYVQTGCPVTGDSIGEPRSTTGTAIPIGGVKIRFCCDACRGKIQGMKNLSGRAKAVYSNKAFAKAFKINHVRKTDVDN